MCAHAEDPTEPTDFEHTLLVLSQLQLQRQFQRQGTYTVLAAPRRSVVVPMPLMCHKVWSLFYADDAALISASAEEASVRLTALKKGMEELSDMLIHWGKTKAMHAQQTIEVSKPKPAEYQEKEAKDLRTAKCEGCHESFVNEAGLRVHQRSCDLWNRMGEKDWPVERVIEARGTVEQRFYFVQWKGDWEPCKKRTWIPASWCNCKTAIAEF